MLKKDSYFYYASANALFYFAWAMFASMITVYLAGESLSTSQISWITSASSLFAIISQPICGLIADKIQSPKLVSIVCGALAIISGIFFAYTHSFLLLFLLNGFTQGCMNGLVILTDRLATACPYGYGGIRLWGSVAYAVGAQVSGMIYLILFAQANYIIFAISMLIMIACLFMMRDQKSGIQNKEKIKSSDIFKYLLTNKAFIYFVLIYCLYQGITTSQGIYFPLYMQAIGASTGLVGTALFLFSLADIPIFLISDHLLRRFHYRTILILACLIASLRYLFYALLPNPNWILYFFFLQSLSNAFVMIAAVKVILDLVDEKYLNTAYGLSAMLAKGIFPLIMQIGCGYLLDWIGGIHGYVITYYFYATTAIFCLLLCFRIKKYSKSC